jgi:hypothetical protein
MVDPRQEHVGAQLDISFAREAKSVSFDTQPEALHVMTIIG